MKIDISDCKNLTAKKAKIRTQMTELLIEFLKEKFEDVEGDVLQVGTNEVAVAVAIDDVDGFATDVCVVVKPEVKSWTRPAATAKRQTEPYDRFDAAEAYEEECRVKKQNRKSNPEESE